MKCLNCEYCAFGKDNDGSDYAKCMKTSKRGKCITWAFTTLNNNYSVKEKGEDRVKKELSKAKKEPNWCPLKKENELPQKEEINIEEYLDEDLVCDIVDSIVDKLSDKYGYCIENISCELVAKIHKIDWDTKED